MNKNNVIANMLWRFAERCGSQGINFVVAIILARVLSPDEYSTIALVTVFITILQVFVNSGLPHALIQKKKQMTSIFQPCFTLTCFFASYFILHYTFRRRYLRFFMMK